MIYVETIPHKNQRYPTCGDWQFLPGGLHVSVSDTGNRMSNMLVALHEIVEAILCEARGVSEKAVDEFDIRYEASRKEGDFSEPGDDPKAPYHEQHRVADIVERMVALHAKVDWKQHESNLEQLG